MQVRVEAELLTAYMFIYAMYITFINIYSAFIIAAAYVLP